MNASSENASTPRSFQDRLAVPALAAIVVYAALRNLVQATIKPIWFDEILTEIISRKLGFTGLWGALKTAVDSNPPPFYLIERAASAFSANEHIAYRLPSILAFSCTLICVYAFVARRSGRLAGLVSASLILLSPLYDLYADEARPYSMVIACVAFALVCYQQAPSVPWTIGLFAALFLAMCLHYYAALTLGLFLGAEAFFTYHARRIRPLVWLALLFALVPIAIFRPLLVALKSYYGNHFWASPQLMGAFRTYGEFFRIGTPWGFALGGACALAVLFAFFKATFAAPSVEGSEPCPAHEHLLVLMLLAYPFIVFIFAKVMHGGSLPRYALCGILGIATALPYVLERFHPRAAFVTGAFLLLAFGTQEFSFWRTLRSNIGAPARPASEMLAFLDSVHRDDLPCVFADAGEYFDVQHYASPRLRQRAVALVDPASGLRYSGSDSLDKDMIAIGEVTSINVYEFSAFVATHRSFLLYANRSVDDWLPERLIQEGGSLDLLAAEGTHLIYLVHLSPV